MKITEKLAAFQAANGSEPFVSIEFFPPKTEEGVKNLEARFERYHAEGESQPSLCVFSSLFPRAPHARASENGSEFV